MTISPIELTLIAYKISQRFEKVNTMYLTLMAKRVKEVGEFSPTDLHRLEMMAKMGNDIDAINSELSKQTGLALQDIYKLYEKSGGQIYKDVAYLYAYKKLKQPDFSKNVAIQNYINSVKSLTRNTFLNMARTTVIRQSYRDVIDLAIDTVATGMDDYRSVMRRMLIDKAQNGMKVEYASGYKRRLDSACRMNILEGVRQVNAGVREQCGKEYGADGVEIDAHGLCAEDHLPYQGKQYSIDKYNKINNSLKRQFGTCNCQHNISYIILGVSPPTYDKQELEDMKAYSNEKIKIGNKEVTRYQASQLMRQTETKMRYKKDEIITLETAGISASKERQQLRDLQSVYRNISSSANLQKRYDRAYVPGFKK